MRAKSMIPTENDIPYMVIPENRIQKKLGISSSMRQAFSPEAINRCQRMMDDAYDSFYAEMQKEVGLLQQEIARVEKSSDIWPVAAQKITAITDDIRKKFETTGGLFGYQVARSLYQYVKSSPDCSHDVLMTVQKHLEIMEMVAHNIRVDAETESAVLGSLAALVHKMQHRRTQQDDTEN